MKRALLWVPCIVLLCGLCGMPAGAQESTQGGATNETAIARSHPIVQGLYRSRNTASNLPSFYTGTGDHSIEDAVKRGLRWLTATQHDDGSWGSADEPATVATGLALLALLAHGETPASPEFGKAVEGAIQYLLSIQTDDGTFNAAVKCLGIEHAIVARALCDAYGMTRSPLLPDRCGKAVAVIIKAQRPSGMWSADYSRTAGTDDVEATVWQIHALKSAFMVGLEQGELRPALEAARKAIAQTVEPSIPDKTTAPAVSCLQITGYSKVNSARAGLKALEGIGLTLDWQSPGYDNPLYHWFFITQANFQHGGRNWVQWNKPLFPLMVRNQTVQAAESMARCGFWVSPGKGERYGRVYATALCCLMLQRYYRFLPFSTSLDDGGSGETGGTNEVKSTIGK